MNATSDDMTPDEHDSVLAAEYVVGVLPSLQRQQVAARIAQDPAFAKTVASYEEKFSPLVADVKPARPSDSVWQGIEASLFAGSDGRQDAARGFWSSLVAWRAIAAASLIVATVATSVPFLRSPEPASGTRLTATLQSEQTPDKFTVLVDVAKQEMLVTAISTLAEPDKTYELCVIEGDAAPVSLGVVSGGGSAVVSVPEALRTKVANGNLLAVSVEPAGGSSTGAPTGPVVAAGKITGL